MTVHLANITIDCDDALVVSRFWSAALDRPLADEPAPSTFVAAIGNGDHDTGDSTDGGPNWLFLKVPEGKAAKNRMHVDLVATVTRRWPGSSSWAPAASPTRTNGATSGR